MKSVSPNASGRFWSTFEGILAESARGLEGAAANATASAAADRTSAKDAGERATAASERIERLRRGDADVPRGHEIDLEKILREIGMTTADLNHYCVLAQLPEEVAVSDLTAISLAAGERAARAAARRLLRQLVTRR